MKIRLSLLLLSALLAACTGFEVPESYPTEVLPGTAFATEPVKLDPDTPVYSAEGRRSFEISSDLAAMRAMEDCLPGTVELEFMVAPDGRPVNVRILESEPAGYYDRVAFNALQESRYEPEVVDGVWQPVVQQRRVEFNVPASCR